MQDWFQRAPLVFALALCLTGLSCLTVVHIARQLPDLSLHRRRHWRWGGGWVLASGLWTSQWLLQWAVPTELGAGFDVRWVALGLLPVWAAGAALLWVAEGHAMGRRRLGRAEAAAAGALVGLCLLALPATGVLARGGSLGWQGAAVLGQTLACGLSGASLVWLLRPPRPPRAWRWLASPRMAGAGLAAAASVLLCAPWPVGSPAALWPMPGHGEGLLGAAALLPWLGVVGFAGLMLPLALLVLAQKSVLDSVAQVHLLQESNELLQSRARELSQDLQSVQRQAEHKRSAMMETAAVNFFEVQVAQGLIAFAERSLYLAGGRRHLLSAQTFQLAHWHLQVHPDDVGETSRRLQDCMDGLSDEFEAPYRLRVDGHDWRWIMARARVVEWTPERKASCLYGTLIDVHEDRCRQLALDEERQMLTTGPVVMVRVAVAEAGMGMGVRFAYVSDNVGKLWGHDGGSLMALPSWLALVHHEDAEPLRDGFERALGRSEPTGIDLEMRLRMADGVWRWFRYSTLINPASEVHRGYFVDIDARKQAELEASTQRQRLQEMVLQLEAAQDEGGVFQDTSDMLHATERMEEAFEIIRLSALRLFPAWSGQVAAVREGGTELVIGAQWGPVQLSPQGQFEGSGCWAIRRGKAHSFFNFETSICCPHMRHVPAERMRPHVCIPMAAHGETVGALNLWFHGEQLDESHLQQVQQRASRFAETLKLAMSNLKLRASLQNQAMTDSLTTLYNRRYMDESLLHELQRARRAGHPVSLAMIDVDHFKRFNDDFGHDAGDAVLRGIAAVLQDSTRGYDVACRYGGEEMAVIMPGCELDDAVVRIEQVRQLVAQLQLRHEGVGLPAVTISAGVAVALGGDPAALVRRADEALYEAKQAGRNRVARAQPLSLTTVMGDLSSERAALA